MIFSVIKQLTVLLTAIIVHRDIDRYIEQIISKWSKTLKRINNGKRMFTERKNLMVVVQVNLELEEREQKKMIRNALYCK